MIERAAKLLRSGRLVAFPTETVYGLGADATNADAVRRIFAAKGRPPTNPLIVHVADATVAQRYAREWPDAAARLAERYWPGPLTLVLPKAPCIVSEVTAGKDTVGLRAPDHPLTLELLGAFDGPLAGPSANRSNHISPTTAEHVREELGEAVDLILDGGPCRVGIESTVLDLSAAVPTILRPGGVSREQIERVIGPVELSSGVTDVTMPASAPGQHERHYAPRTPAYRFNTDQRGLVPFDDGVGLVALSPLRVFKDWDRIVAMPRDPDWYAQLLYSVLRTMDEKSLRVIYIEMPPDEPQWLAIRDRLRRATRPFAVV